MKVSLNINGRAVSADIEPRLSLADFLRGADCNLTSVHLGCEHGVCGACTVLIDGQIARSCIALAAACDDSEITTLEGLKDDKAISELKDAFHEHHGLQCGFCTPAMLISAREVLAQGHRDETAIREAMSGNLCRCTGYAGIVDAMLSVAARQEKPDAD